MANIIYYIIGCTRNGEKMRFYGDIFSFWWEIDEESFHLATIDGRNGDEGNEGGGRPNLAAAGIQRGNVEEQWKRRPNLAASYGGD